LACAEFIGELLHELDLCRCSKELHVGYGLLNLICHFIKTWVVVGLTKCPINTDEIVDALFLTAVLPITSHTESVTESDNEQSDKSRDKNL